MKKIISFLLVVSSIFLLCSCSNKILATDYEISDLAYNYYKEIIDTKSFYVEYSTEISGKSALVKLAVSGDDFGYFSESDGKPLRTVYLKGEYYVLNNQEKTVDKYLEAPKMPGMIDFNLQNPKPKQIEKNVKFEGKDCIKETVSTFSGDVSMFFENGVDFVGIKTRSTSATILKFLTTVPDYMMTISPDYESTYE